MSKLIAMTTFDKLLTIKFIEWQQKQGERKTVREFAQWLGVAQSTVSMWWNNRSTPQGNFVRLLADKLGPEVYDALDLPRPDPDLTYLQAH